MYTQCQNFFIYYFEGSTKLGIYSVALTMATGIGVLINALVTSCYASIYSEFDEKRAAEKAGMLLRWVAVISLSASIILMAVGEKIILKLYGAEFISAHEPMIILSFASVLSFMGSVTYRYIMHYSGFFYLSIKTVLSLLLSILLTGPMVKHYGIIGAAWAVVIVEFLSLTVMSYFFKRKSVLNMHLLAIKGDKK
ncbi:oligosaccharide flippase family protein [Brenneria sp. WC1b.1]|nr:oligosaccharide flippase family protein [Brenneria tiliae]MCL2896803.1 oligosaccharide flippase family protein [Brenneria tiliae]MCL2901361.1 oligosaccharide flippase family protein [Brenneria tiliae]